MIEKAFISGQIPSRYFKRTANYLLLRNTNVKIKEKKIKKKEKNQSQG